MRNIFNRVYGKRDDSEPKILYEGLLILSSDVKRLNDSKLEGLNSEFAGKVRQGANYLSELFSVIPDNEDIGLFDSQIETIIGRTSKPEIRQLELYDLIYPVFSALRNHHF